MTQRAVYRDGVVSSTRPYSVNAHALPSPPPFARACAFTEYGLVDETIDGDCTQTRTLIPPITAYSPIVEVKKKRKKTRMFSGKRQSEGAIYKFRKERQSRFLLRSFGNHGFRILHEAATQPGVSRFHN